VLGIAAYWTGAAEVLVARFPNLRVHANQAFYSTVFVVLFPVWLLTTFGLNRFHYFTFDRGRQVGDIQRVWGSTRTFTANNISVSSLPDDFFVHRVLGLWWLGLGTGDVVVRFSDPGGGVHHEVITNVWRAKSKVEAVNRRIQ
jgi:hypothetical protein